METKYSLMKLIRLYFLILNFFFISSTSFFGATNFQEPKTERHFKSDFKDAYSGRKYDYKGIPKVHSVNSTSGKPSKYSKNRPYVREDHNSDNFSLNFKGLNGIFIVILFLAVAFLAYTLMNDGSSKLFGSRQFKKLKPTDAITAENLAQTDMPSLIQTAEDNSDYRLAIRYYYLLVLQQLALKNLITFEDDKTNADYMQDIANQKFSKDFAYSSYLYNYIWYGEFTVDAPQYASAKKSFMHLLKNVEA